jgi:putative inorganic carbon (HCO3(-)) transporter
VTVFFSDTEHLSVATSGVTALALYATVIAGALLSIVWRSEIGVYLLTLILPLQTTRYHLHPFPLGGKIVDILILCTLAGALLRPPAKLARRPGLVGFLAFMAMFYLVSLFRGAFFLGSSMPVWFNDERLVDYKNFIVMPVLALVVMWVIRSRRQIAIILLLACATAVAVDYSYLKSSVGRDFSHYAEETRDAGPLGYAGENGLASYVVEITACLIPFLALPRFAIRKLLLLCLLSANVTCILYSYSREAYLALAASLCFIAIVRIRWLIIPILMAAFAWQTVLPVAVQERMTMSYTSSGDGFAPELDGSAQERITLWTDAMEVIRENPILGTGFLTYARLNRVGSYRDTHNFYLKMLVETGVLGALLFVMQLGYFFRQGWLLFRRSTDPFLSILGLGFASLMLSAAIVNFFGDRWLYIQVDSNLWILLGCVVSASSQIVAEQQPLGDLVSGDFTAESAVVNDARDSDYFPSWAGVTVLPFCFRAKSVAQEGPKS